MAKKNHALRRKSVKRAAARQQRIIMDRVHNPNVSKVKPPQPPKRNKPGG